MLLKACRFAVEFNELYQPQDFAKVDRLLQLAEQRLQALTEGQAAWAQADGRQIRGFVSGVGGSVQPLGMILPPGWQTASQPLPLYVWLHGRGDKATDVHFLCERLDKNGQIVPEGALVLHPFGRQCIGYKSAGETDVMEAIDWVCANYPVDQRRIVLMGFSMGGAGVWHLAAHYGERFVAASPGAGFAETARYQGLQPNQFPAEYEQLLWKIYDVPGYTRNLFNLPVVAYSGEVDKQIQAARVMEEAFAEHGRTLEHLIGPGMGHKYAPQTLAEILERMAAAAAEGQPEFSERWYLQSPHPRYATRDWLTIDGVAQQYQDTRADVEKSADAWRIATENARRLIIDTTRKSAPQTKVIVDDQPLEFSKSPTVRLVKSPQGVWSVAGQFAPVRKHPGLSGPIDDAFIDPFLVVLPSASAASPAVEQWIRCELESFRQRWAMLFRGQLRIKHDHEVTRQDMRDYHLVLWGDPSSNQLIGQLLAQSAASPLRWSSTEVGVAGQTRSAEDHVLLAIYPNPLAPERYVVLNSGPTFRQAHDRTNSLQNPHLPDWAVISLQEPPSAERPGQIVRAGFFNDQWQVEPQLSF